MATHDSAVWMSEARRLPGSTLEAVVTLGGAGEQEAVLVLCL